MLKIFQILCLLCFNLCLFGQSDFDFEEFEVGDYISESSPYWSTASGEVTFGTGQDGQVVDTYAKSGTKSVRGSSDSEQYFASFYLNFGQQFKTGLLNIKYSIYIPSGKTAYVWLRESLTNVPFTYNQTSFFPNNTFQSQSGSIGIAAYQNDVWNDIEYQCDFDNEILKILVNGENVMTLEGYLAISTIIFRSIRNSFPSDFPTEFFIDDVSFVHSNDAPTFTNELMIGSSEGEFGAVGQEKEISNKIINKGDNFNGEITVNALYDNQTLTQNLGVVSIPAGEEYEFKFDEKLLVVEGDIPLEMNIMPTNDEDLSNNKFTTVLSGRETFNEKVMLIEASVNNAYGYYPYAHVKVPQIKEYFGDKVAIINVHLSGPMENLIYRTWISEENSLFGTGSPSIYIERSEFPEFGSWWGGRTVNYLKNEPSATFKINMIPSENDELKGTAELEITALKDISKDHNISLIFSENNVTGTLGYEAANVYSNLTWNLGEMGGFEDLPNPVPAIDMTYQDVARDILPQPKGLPIGRDLAAGEVYTIPIKYEINPKWIPIQMSVTAALFNADGTANNAKKVTFEEAGFFGTDSNEDIQISNDLNIYPNPTDGNAVIAIDFDEVTHVQVNILDISGKTVLSRDFGNLIGKQTINLNNLTLKSGIYSVVLKTNNSISTQKLIVR